MSQCALTRQRCDRHKPAQATQRRRHSEGVCRRYRCCCWAAPLRRCSRRQRCRRSCRLACTSTQCRNSTCSCAACHSTLSPRQVSTQGALCPRRSARDTVATLQLPRRSRQPARPVPYALKRMLRMHGAAALSRRAVLTKQTLSSQQSVMLMPPPSSQRAGLLVMVRMAANAGIHHAGRKSAQASTMPCTSSNRAECLRRVDTCCLWCAALTHSACADLL